MPSTVIRSYRYDRRRRALDVVFQSRRRCTYLGVPEETYDRMKAAFSKGEFFNRHIRDHFTFERNGEEFS
ncbi:MAG: hypothetical protein FD144_742 [Rhodospirillaceae bacterium]|nr:MAG: hypothetical protein FD144_742 [Rhodospirillaceae bacterium]